AYKLGDVATLPVHFPEVSQQTYKWRQGETVVTHDYTIQKESEYYLSFAKKMRDSIAAGDSTLSSGEFLTWDDVKEHCKYLFATIYKFIAVDIFSAKEYPTIPKKKGERGLETSFPATAYVKGYFDVAAKEFAEYW
ncbi:hypothetical protein ADUPG1_012480, partial [Aduncisulcus paluster]